MAAPSRPAYAAAMSVTYLDPRAEPSRPIEPYRAGLRLPKDGSPVTIGLLANGFPDSVAFLDHVEKALVEVAPGPVRFTRESKGNASAPASDQLVNGMAKEVHAVVTAYGH